jgi:hypothetical protein
LVRQDNRIRRTDTVGPRRAGRRGTIELRRSGAYDAARAALDSYLQRELDLVEEEIAVDPWRTFRRHDREDGVVIDYSGPGLMVGFRIREGVIELVEVLDVTKAPPRS